MLPIIKQLEEKNLPYEIDHIVWNDRMDLVAYSTTKGEVALHRLSWARAWILNPPCKNIRVICITFRPDGKVIAIAYSNGEMWIVSIENKEICTNINSKKTLSCMSWVQEKSKSPNNGHKKVFPSSEDEHQNYIEFIDLSPTYLAETPLMYAEDNIRSPKKRQRPSLLYEQNELNILAVGSKEGIMNLYVYGEYPFVEIDIKGYIEMDCSIENILFREDLSKISVTVKLENGDMKIIMIDSSIITSRTKEIFAFSNKCIQLFYLTTVIRSSIRSMKESWESILIEVDNKLSKYASTCSDGGVSAEFLDLLMFGRYSQNMQTFLLQDLTKKGLEKFGEGVEFIDACEEDVTNAIRATGAFLLKAGEMHQTINQSIVTYKCFFKWLYRALMVLLDDQYAEIIHPTSQQELVYICEFFENFDNMGEKGVTMEKLGQYLSPSPLTMPPKMEDNEWSAFLNENECLKNDPTLLHLDKGFSLIMQFDKLKTHVSSVVRTSKNIDRHFRKTHVLNCLKPHAELPVISVNREDSIVYFFPKSLHEITLLQINLKGTECSTKGCDFNFIDHTEPKNRYELCDMKVYNSSTISLLLRDVLNRTSILYQFSIEAALFFTREIDISEQNLNDQPSPLLVNGTYLNPKIFKDIQMMGSQLAVSGSRKVGIVLSANKHKVKLFEMECEEEDEDADMSI